MIKTTIHHAAPSGNFLRLSPPDSVILESIAVTVKSWVCFSIVYEITYLIERFFKYSIFRQFYASIRFGSVDHTLIMSTEQIAEMTKGHKDARHSYLMVQQVRKNAIAEIRSISSDIQSLERKIKEGTILCSKISIVSGVVSGVAMVAAPFTGGGSLTLAALTGFGTGIGIGAGVCDIIQKWISSSK
jgi:hypothetical protein